MAKRQYANQPVNGGVRKRRNSAPTSDGTRIKYNAVQQAFPTVTSGYTGEIRSYVPGLKPPLAQTVGPELVSYYSTGKFLPGTSARWEPSVSFTTTGRVFVGFTDNPEVATSIATLFGTALTAGTAAAWGDYANAVKGLGSLQSWPVWQETEVSVPSNLRRKMFDVNETLTIGPDVLDRSMQTLMAVAIEGLPGGVGNPGGFWFHDNVQVEGLHGTLT